MTDPKSNAGVSGYLARIPFHPVLIAATPALIMLTANIDQLRPRAALRAILFSILAGVALLLLLRFLMRSWRKAALVTSVLILFFFSYGQLYGYLRTQGDWGWAIARHRYMLPVWLAMFIGCIWLLLRLHKHVGVLTSVFNLIALVVVIIALVQIATFEVRSNLAASRLDLEVAGETALQLPVGQPVPDIYYIVPDSYERDDYLLLEYGYDNQPFLDALGEMGFYVAKCSQSNYVSTNLSLPSSMNLDYLEALGDEFQAGRTETHGLLALMKNSRVQRELEALGYSIVAFETGFIITQLDDADYYYEVPQEGTLAQLFGLEGVNGFEAILIQNSGARILTDAGNVVGILSKMLPDLNRPRSIYRDRTLFVLDQLAPDKVPSIRGPKFVFVHIISPHYPYVIDRQGEFVNRETANDDREAYIDQLAYTSARLEEVLRGIIETADVPPIVVLQADTGNGAVRNQATEILNAYFLPGDGSAGLYPGISPVNAFRLIFNTYFGGNFDLLEDVSYSSTSAGPYDLVPVPETRPGCGTDEEKSTGASTDQSNP